MTAVNSTRTADALDAFRGDRTYLGADHRRNERRTWIVTGICTLTLAAQVAGGLAFRSMALTAAGLHMAAHVAALVVAAGAYAFSRRHARDPRFSFGAGKLGYLAGFTNAVLLAVTAVLIAVQSIQRLLAPQAVDYDQAIGLAAAGLAVTLLCAWLLKPRRQSSEDINISVAHLHLTADALVGVLALAGLAAGRALGWGWADPVAGLAGAFLVGHFAVRLILGAAGALLDMNPSSELTSEIRRRLQAQGETVLDLHLWRLGPGHHAAVAVVRAAAPLPAEAYHDRLRDIAGLSHVTVEVRGPGAADSHRHSDA